MGFFLTYSLICSVILILVWSVYKCTLSRLNCFRFNRVALSCGYVISFVLPAIILHLNDGSPATNATVSMLFETVGCDDPGHLIMFETPQASMTDYIAVGYVIGCSVWLHICFVQSVGFYYLYVGARNKKSVTIM